MFGNDYFKFVFFFQTNLSKNQFNQTDERQKIQQNIYAKQRSLIFSVIIPWFSVSFFISTEICNDIDVDDNEHIEHVFE